MKTHAIFTTLIVLALIFTSCNKDDENVTPSDTVTTVTKNIIGYSKLDVSDAFKVYITFSDTDEKVQIEANDNLQAYINVQKQNDWLVIWIDDNVNVNGNSVLNIYITINNIDEFSAEGASKINLQNDLNTNNIEIELTGASSFNGTLFTNELNSTLTGASILTIVGESDSFDIEFEGASNMEGFNFITNHLIADLEGACNVSLTVNVDLNVKAEGASNVYYKGNGIIESQNLSGGSQIIKVE